MMKGFSILEMMVAMVITLVITASVAGNINFQKRTFTEGALRSRINQNLRGALDIIGTDIRIGGENLPMGFPAILIIDGVTDQLVVRRSLLDEALPVCADIPAGYINPEITVADDSSATPGCAVDGIETAFNRWNEFRNNQGGTMRAYLFNLSTKAGEYFTVGSQTNNTTNLTLSKEESTPFSNNYPAGSSVIYVLEEWTYRIDGDELQVIQNGETEDPLTVLFGVDTFSVTATLSNNSTVNSLAANDSWTAIKFIEIKLEAEESKPNGSIRKAVTSRFFPRNILSF
jgi:type IV pilus assembly protein PilW